MKNVYGFVALGAGFFLAPFNVAYFTLRDDSSSADVLTWIFAHLSVLVAAIAFAATFRRGSRLDVRRPFTNFKRFVAVVYALFATLGSVVVFIANAPSIVARALIFGVACGCYCVATLLEESAVLKVERKQIVKTVSVRLSGLLALVSEEQRRRLAKVDDAIRSSSVDSIPETADAEKKILQKTEALEVALRRDANADVAKQIDELLQLITRRETALRTHR